MKLLYLKVLDHCTDPDPNWKELDSMNINKTEIEVVGFLAKEDDDYYFMVQAHGEEQYSNCFRVLKSTVVKRKEFKVPK